VVWCWNLKILEEGVVQFVGVVLAGMNEDIVYIPAFELLDEWTHLDDPRSRSHDDCYLLFKI
jgi:hypothetical protein